MQPEGDCPVNQAYFTDRALLQHIHHCSYSVRTGVEISADNLTGFL
jgi:hypothetical protein